MKVCRRMPLGGIFGGGGSSKAHQLSSSDGRHHDGKERDVRGTILVVNSHTVAIEKKLAEGGFAIVYLVTDKKNRQFALKRQFINDDVKQLEACKRECQIISGLRGHKNIVEYVAHVLQKTKTGVYDCMLLTAYYKTSVLGLMNDRLAHGKVFSANEVLAIFCDMCEAVARLHHSNIPVIHRDLKVENILVDERNRGAPAIYVLCDFGSATTKVLTTETTPLAVIQDEIDRYTTLSYRAPEMVDLYGGKPIGTKADIWALGVMLYKLAYFGLPFGDSAMAIQNGAFSFPTTPEHSIELKALISRLLDGEQETRPNIYQVASLAFQAARRQNPVINIEKVSTPSLEESVKQLLTGRKSSKVAEPVQATESRATQDITSAAPIVAGTTSVNPRLRPKPTNSVPRLPNIAAASPLPVRSSAVRGASTSEPDMLPVSIAAATLPPPEIADSGPLSCPLTKADASFDGLDEIARRHRPSLDPQPLRLQESLSMHRRNQSDCSTTVIKSAFKPYSRTKEEERDKEWNPFTAAPYGNDSGEPSFVANFASSAATNTDVSAAGDELDSCSIDSRDPFGAAPFDPPTSSERRRLRSERERDDSLGSTSDLHARIVQEDSSDMDEVRAASRRRFSYEHIDGVGDDASSDSRARTEDDSNTDDQKLDDEDDEDAEASQTTEGGAQTDEEGGNRPLLDEDELGMECEDNDALWIDVQAKKCTNPFLASYQPPPPPPQTHSKPSPKPSPMQDFVDERGAFTDRRDTLTFDRLAQLPPTQPPLDSFQAPATLPRQVTPLFNVQRPASKTYMIAPPPPPVPTSAPVVSEASVPAVSTAPATATLVDLSELPAPPSPPKPQKEAAPPIPAHASAASFAKSVFDDKPDKPPKKMSDSHEYHTTPSSSIVTSISKGFGYYSPRVKGSKKKNAPRKFSSSSTDSPQTDDSGAEMFASTSEAKSKKLKHKLRGSHSSIVAVAPTDLKLTPMDVQKQLQKKGLSSKRASNSTAASASFVNSSFQAEDMDSPPRARNPVIQKS